MAYIRFWMLSVLVLTVSIQTGLARSSEKKSYTATKVNPHPPIVDGILDDPIWQKNQWSGNFIQSQPHDGKEPSQQTEFMIAYDADFLYAAFKMQDTEPDKIVGRVTRRDDIDGDWIALGLDSYNDKRTAFCFIVNAAGVKRDMVITEDGNREDQNWDPIWHVKTARADSGWTAEMKIPLNQLRFKDAEDMEWGLQVMRGIHRNQEESMWQHIPKDAPGFVHQFGQMIGLSGLKPKKQIEIAPYVVTKTESFKPEEGNPYMTGKRNDFNVGIDAKIGITNNFTVDLTVNPDFGQVEADPATVNLTAFETYFEEKRPFFIEGSNLLSFPLAFGDGDQAYNNLFYSRRLGRSPQLSASTNDGEYANEPSNTTILGAAKLTGRTRNGMSVGLLETLTANAYALIDSSGKERKQIVEPMTNYSVATIKQEFNNGNTLFSGLVTSTNRQLDENAVDVLHKNAYSGGISLEHNWANKKYQIAAKVYGSHVEGTQEAILGTQLAPARYLQRPDRINHRVDSSRTSLSGNGGLINIGKVGEGHVRFMGMLSWQTPQLEINDIGFIQSVDEIFQAFWVGLRYWEQKGIFKSVNVNFNQWTGWNFDGQSSYYGGNVNFHTQFTNYWSISAGINRQGESHSTGSLRGGPTLRIPGSTSSWYNISSDQRKEFVVGAGGNTQRGDLDYSFNQNVYANFSYKPLRSLLLRISPGYSYQQNELQYVQNPDFGNEKRYVRGDIERKTYYMSLRIEYSVSPNLSIQYFGRPYLSSGKFSDYKYITNPKADDYTSRFSLYDANQIEYDQANKVFRIDENRDGTIDYTFNNRDFNYLDLQSTMVLRWEFKPGSTFFAVWTHGKNSYESTHSSSLSNDVDNLYSSIPHNIFLLKFSYRFN
jgi:hypothetical protein